MVVSEGPWNGFRIVNGALEADIAGPEQHHPQASANALPNADDIFREVTNLSEKWAQADLPMSERAVIKDRLRYLNGRCAWIGNAAQRQFVQQPIDALWEQIMKGL